MKKLLCVLLAILCLASLTACKPKVKTLTEAEIAEIHEKEKELTAQIQGVTWHYTDAPNQGIRFFPDGTAEEYMGDITWIENYSWVVRYCCYTDMEAANLATADREFVLKYYEYALVMANLDESLSGKPFEEKVSVDGNTLTWGIKTLTPGTDFLKTMPVGLGTREELLEGVYHDEADAVYYLFFPDGTGFLCNTVFLDGTPMGEEKFYWGTEGDNLYICRKRQPGGEGPVLDDVHAWALKPEATGFQMTNLWNGLFHRLVLTEDDVAQWLLHNYDMLHEAIQTWGY